MSNDNPLEDLSQDKPEVNLQKPNPYAQQPSPPYQQQPPSTHQPQHNPNMNHSGYTLPAYVIPIQQKSLLLAYVLWFFLAGIGLHKFYLGKIKTGIAWIVACCVVPAIMFTSLLITAIVTAPTTGASTVNTDASVTGAAFGAMWVLWIIAIFIWWIVDACLMPSQTLKANEDIRIKYSNRVA